MNNPPGDKSTLAPYTGSPVCKHGVYSDCTQCENGELRRLLNIERRKVRDLWKRVAELERRLAEQSA